jgi:hypothetical protein
MSPQSSEIPTNPENLELIGYLIDQRDKNNQVITSFTGVDQLAKLAKKESFTNQRQVFLGKNGFWFVEEYNQETQLYFFKHLQEIPGFEL